MTSKELNQRLNKGILDNLYLFYGNEDYIKDVYINKIKETALKSDFSDFNFTRFDEMPSKDELNEVIESAPVMSEKKVILLNSLNIVATSVKGDIKSEMQKILSDIPKYTILIIKEKISDPKKISKPLFDLLKKNGVVVKCDYLEYNELISFANKQFAALGKKIKRGDLEYLISISDSSIYSVLGEIEKISMYLDKEEIVSRDAIKLLVKPSIEDKVFGLSDAIIQKDKKLAYRILQDLTLFKNQHPAGKIFSIVCDHFINLYIIVNNKKERIPDSISINLAELYGRAFLIKKYQNQGRKISVDKLKQILSLLNELDFKIKNGLIEPYYAIEQIITAV